jgi:hypothetical protein
MFRRKRPVPQKIVRCPGCEINPTLTNTLCTSCTEKLDGR